MPEVIEKIEELRPKVSYLTHISHEIDHDLENKRIAKATSMKVELAYDGLKIKV